MATFPSLIPADAIITPGAISAAVVAGYDGSTVTTTADTMATGDTLTLPFKNLTEAEANSVRNHARDQQGRPFVFDAVTLAPALSQPNYAWVYAADPQQEDIRSVTGSELYFLTCTFRAVRVRVALVPTATSRIVLRTTAARALPAGPPAATSIIRLATTAAGVPTAPPAAKSLILLRTIAANTLDTTIYDPFFESNLLLCGFNGANGSTTFDDEGPLNLTLTAVGNAQISTEQSVFGGSSLKLDQPNTDSSASAVQLPTDSRLTIAGEFTLDVRLYMLNFKGHAILSGPDTRVSANTGDANIAMAIPGSGGVISQGYWRSPEELPKLNGWNVFRFTRKLNTAGTGWVYYFFARGILIMTYDSGALGSLNFSGGRIGWFANNGCNGYIDEIRLSAICRGTTNYTVDTAPFLRQ
jgi:hypothetical protein